MLPELAVLQQAPCRLEPTLHVHAAAEDDGVVAVEFRHVLGRQAVRVVTGGLQLIRDGGGDLRGGAVLARVCDENAAHRCPASVATTPSWARSTTPMKGASGRQ